jgi:N-acetylglucosamine-6-phosphate deacetylase
MELEVGADQIVRQPGKTNFAGSAARPIEVVFRAAEMLAGPWQEAWGRLAQSPAGFMGLQNELAVGQRASFCVLKLAATNRLLEMQVYAEGKAAVTRL